jgi:hypothetical protein
VDAYECPDQVGRAQWAKPPREASAGCLAPERMPSGDMSGCESNPDFENAFWEKLRLCLWCAFYGGGRGPQYTDSESAGKGRMGWSLGGQAPGSASKNKEW